MAGVPYVFGNATTSIPLTNLDANFNTGLTIGNTTVGLGNTVTTLGNVTLTNATIVANTSSIAANAVVYTTSTGNLTGNASVFTVNSTGNVGIGTSSPTYKLQMTGYMAIGAQSSSGAGAAISFIPSSTTTNWLVGSNYSVGGVFEITPSTTGGGSTFTSPALTLNANGALVLTGGNTSASGVGIAFPSSQSASSDANTLDDYEKGTFTPTYTFNSGSATITAYGYYTKVGNAVTVNCYVGITAIGTASGSATLAGFPFTAKNTSNRTIGFGVNGDNWVGTVGSVSGYITQNTTVGGFYYHGTGSANGFAATNTPTTAYMVFSVTYLT